MKRLLAALLAALMLLTLAACKQDEVPADPDVPETSQSETPEETESPEQSETEEPSDNATQTEPSESTETLSEGAAAITDRVTEGQVEEYVSYRITVPEIDSGDDAADQIFRDYYMSAAGKVEDLCWGEVYEQAMEEHTLVHVEADYAVMRNDDEVLSIRRTVTVTDLNTSKAQVTMYAETFARPGGGLLTAGDFFTQDPTERLVEQVRRIISEDPYHDQNYDPQWSDLCESAFNKDQFYVTDDFYVVYYQDGDLGLGGKTVFEIPWDALKDIAR